MSERQPTVVVTGGATGIGAAVARRFAREGWSVTICGRRQDRLHAMVKAATDDGLDVRAIRADVTDPESIDGLIDAVVTRNGGVDAWVNNAGTVELRPLREVTLDQWNSALTGNLTSVFLCSVRAAAVMETCGSIVNVSSFAGIIPAANNGPYSVAKTGMLALTRVLAAEYAPAGIRVNSIVPGYTSTEMGDIDIKIKAEEILKPIALRRFGRPDEIASAVYFLSGPEASYITGERLVVSGGKFAVQNAQEVWEWSRP